jgi:hypothetical protein
VGLQRPASIGSEKPEEKNRLMTELHSRRIGKQSVTRINIEEALY